MICGTCGLRRTGPWPRRIPSFWTPASGFSVEEYAHACVEARLPMFDPKLHRNQGWKGGGRCLVKECGICRILSLHGA